MLHFGLSLEVSRRTYGSYKSMHYGALSQNIAIFLSRDNNDKVFLLKGCSAMEKRSNIKAG